MKADPSNTDFVKSIQKRRPKIGIFSNVPFMAETQHNMNFKPYKIDKPIEGAQSKLLITPSNLVDFFNYFNLYFLSYE